MNSRTAWLSASFLTVGAVFTLSAHAMDSKPVSTAVCQPYTSTPIDPSKLRVRADGITNDYDTAKFVICPVPKDSSFAWDKEYIRDIVVWFRRLRGAPITGNQCTLTAGWNQNDPIDSVTLPAVKDTDTNTYGYVWFNQNTGPNAKWDGYAVLVCRIAPGNTMDKIMLLEMWD